MDGNSEEVGRVCVSVCYGCGGVVRVCVWGL